MILPHAVAHGVAACRVRLAYRRWTEPRVGVGDRFVSVAGVIEVTGVERVDPASISGDDAAAAGTTSATAVRSALRGSPADPVFRIGLRWAGPDPRDELSTTTTLTADDVAYLQERLARLDRHSTHGPWTRAMLRLIEARPGVRAVDLAETAGRGRDPFKLDVRKLKNLGLTHSLAVGYRLSPRGARYLDATRSADGEQ